MRKENLLIIISYLFISLFVYTALSKWFAYSIYLYDLQRSPELSKIAAPVSIIIPATELVAAGLLLFQRTRLKGLILSLALMTIFTIYVAYVLIFSPELPCTCGGIIRQLSWPQHLIFNIIFTGLAFIGVKLSRHQTNIATHRNSLPV